MKTYPRGSLVVPCWCFCLFGRIVVLLPQRRKYIYDPSDDIFHKVSSRPAAVASSVVMGERQSRQRSLYCLASNLQP